METITTITVCPHCGAELDINKLVTTQMMEGFEEEKRIILQDARSHLESEYRKRFEAELGNARSEQDAHIAALMRQIDQLTETISKGEKERQRMLDELMKLQQKLQSAEFEAKKKASEQLDEICDKIRKDTEETYALKIKELEKKLADTKELAENLKSKAEQGSQQLQGEVLELRLEECLRSEFPLDVIEEVDKGKLGADVIQRVFSRSGKECGIIVWESKNVRNWNNDFIPKLRGDVQRVDGTIGILVSNVFGRNMSEFSLQDGVWLVRPEGALAMARLLRYGMEKAFNERMLAERKETIQDAVYEFVTSPAFRNRVEEISRQYRMLDEEIVKTKTYMERHFATQRRLIDELITNTEGVIGDIGAYVPLLSNNDVPALDSPIEDN